MIWEQLLIMEIGQLQIYLLWFLLGSFTVATLSDLKHMSAQKEFLDVWVIFVISMFASDIYYNIYTNYKIYYLVAKWIIIFAILPILSRTVLRLAKGDIFAKMAACSLFPPVYAVAYLGIEFVIEKITSPLWKLFGKKTAYPFMPVVYVTLIIMLIIISIFNPEFGLSTFLGGFDISKIKIP